MYDAKEAVTKYSVSRQNIMVEDESDIVKVIVSHKTKEDEYTKSIVGKEVEVDGKISIWEGKINIFGKLIFKEGEAPAGTAIAKTSKAMPVLTVPINVKVRGISLERAIQFWSAHIGVPVEEDKVLATAKVFEKYIIG